MNTKLKILLITLCFTVTCGLVSAACAEPQHVYHKVTPAVFKEVKDFVEGYGNLGIKVPCGNEGDMSSMGASVHFIYDGKECLKLQITKLPFFVGSDFANAKLDKFMVQWL